eukprot:1464686-Rhodomonas_salina.1
MHCEHARHRPEGSHTRTALLPPQVSVSHGGEEVLWMCQTATPDCDLDELAVSPLRIRIWDLTRSPPVFREFEQPARASSVLQFSNAVWSADNAFLALTLSLFDLGSPPPAQQFWPAQYLAGMDTA